MKCDKVQEFLFTDYIDGLIAREKEAEIDQHLAGCAKCREVKEAVMATRTAMRGAAKVEPPTYIWHRVKDAIVNTGAEEKTGLGGVLDTLKDLLLGPRYVFARATAVALVMLVLVFAVFAVQRGHVTSKVTVQDMTEIFSFEGNGEEGVSDLGTDIEKYFL